MLNPFRGIDRWASQSGDRVALLVWLVVIVLVALTVIAVAAVFWYTTPAAPSG